MKYIAVFEVPDNEDISEGAILICPLNTYRANIKKAPKPKEVYKPEIHYADDFEEYGTQWIADEGYNQGLKDCGVISDSDDCINAHCVDAIERSKIDKAFEELQKMKVYDRTRTARLVSLPEVFEILKRNIWE